MDFESLATNEITAVVTRLAQAATDAREQAVTALQTAHATEIETLSAEHTAAFAQINGALLNTRREHEAALRELQSTHEAAVGQIQQEHQQGLTESEQERTQALESLAATHQAAVAELTSTHEAAVAQLQAAHASALQEMTTSHEAIVAELNDAQQQMAEHARRQLAVVTAENNRLMTEFTALEKQHAELAEAHVDDTRGALLAHLSTASDRIRSGRSLAEVFCAVGEGLIYDFTRVVVFEIKEQRFEAIHQRGFGNVALDTLSASRKEALLLARALQSSNAHRHVQGDSPAPAFAGSPGTMLTAPLTVHGETVAIVYADDGGATQGRAPEEDCTVLAALLQQQASLRLDRLTIELKATAELRAYARMLVDEAEYVYNADVSAGKSDHDRIAQLQDNIRCARQIFAQRVTAEGPAAVSVLDDVVAERLRALNGSGFATELGNLLLQGDLESTAA